MLSRCQDDINKRDKKNWFALHCVATTAFVIISGYYEGLRGEQINKGNVGATRKYWMGTIEHPE